MSLISICFAVYQNAGSINTLYKKIVEEVCDLFPYHDFELIFVNDGSTDNSLAELKAIKEQSGDSRIKIITFSKNFGQMAAILAGWKYASGDAVINMAADLQDPPSQCSEMIKEWEKGSEIVISYRVSHHTSLTNKATSYLFYKLVLPDVPPGGFDFALLGKKAIDAVRGLQERNRFYQYDILWTGFGVKYLPYNKVRREVGKSQYNFYKRFKNFMVAFINVSYLPLRLMGFFGILTSISGFMYAINIVYWYYHDGNPIQGWSPIMVMLLVLGGLILFMIAILGEYIWRILDEVKGRPSYIIEDIL